MVLNKEDSIIILNYIEDILDVLRKKLNNSPDYSAEYWNIESECYIMLKLSNIIKENGGYVMLNKIKQWLKLKSNKPESLTEHEKAISIMHLNNVIFTLERTSMKVEGYGNWCTKHDIEILKKAIKFLEEN